MLWVDAGAEHQLPKQRRLPRLLLHLHKQEGCARI